MVSKRDSPVLRMLAVEWMKQILNKSSHILGGRVCTGNAFQVKAVRH